MATIGRIESAGLFLQDRRFQEVTKQFKFGPQLRTDGIVSFAMDVTLARNALVRVYDVVVNADRARATAVERVAQVRALPAERSTPASIVLDFGTPRTVSGVLVQAPLIIVGITPWIGASFANQKVFPAGDDSSRSELVILRKEIRTERLLVEVTGTPSGPELWSGMGVLLPEAPGDLEIRIDGGAPVATFPGPAQPGADATLTDQTWNKEGKRIVHLGDALAKLTGDPTNDAQTTFKLVLSSRVPGELDMEVLRGRVPSDSRVPALGRPPQMSFIRRVRFDGDDTGKELVFPAEGVQQIPLSSLPPNPVIEEIRFTVSGTLPPERVVPPVGPDNADLADLLLSPDHAACVRLRSDTGLAEISGIRLPLIAGSDGAEIRLLLWRPDETPAQEPLEAMPDGVSEPVALEATDTEIEIWTTFSFKRPIPINDEAPPWVALSVSRGQVIWRLGAVTVPGDPIAAHVIRRGAPTGPWKLLPKPFQVSTSALGSVRGRLRVIGYAPKDEPLAPLIVGVESSEQTLEVTPSAKGVTSSRGFTPNVSSTNLRVISRVAGNVTLRDLDVVTTA
jgi:hypothetical protein